jgi:hypothetical protein
VQGLSQHTPSTQMPLLQAFPSGQVSPLLRLGAHTLAEQNSVLEQSRLVAQSPAHVVPAHVYGAQLWRNSAGHEPTPSQNASSTAWSFEQLALRQLVPAPG